MGKAVTSFEHALAKMETLGATVVSPANIPSMQDLITNGFDAQEKIQNVDFKEEIAKYLGNMASTDVRNLEDIIEFVHFPARARHSLTIAIVSTIFML
jgi:amidase